MNNCEKCGFDNIQWKCGFRAYQYCYKIKNKCITVDTIPENVKMVAIQELSSMSYLYEGIAKAGIHNIGVRFNIDLSDDQINEVYGNVIDVLSYYKNE